MFNMDVPFISVFIYWFLFSKVEYKYKKTKAVLATLLLNWITVTTSTSLPISTQGRQLLFYGATPTTQSVRIDIYQPTHFLRRPSIENGLFVLYPQTHPSAAEFPESPHINEIFPTINPNAVLIPTKPESNIPEVEPDAVLISNFRPNDPIHGGSIPDTTFHRGTETVTTNRGPNWTFWHRNYPTKPTYPGPDTTHHSTNPDYDFNVRTSTPVPRTDENIEPIDTEQSNEEDTNSIPDDDLDDTVIAGEQEILAEADKNPTLPNFPIPSNSRFPLINQEHRFYILNGQTQFQSNDLPTTFYTNAAEKTKNEPDMKRSQKNVFLINNLKSSYPEFHRLYLSNPKISNDNKLDIQHSSSSSSSRFVNISKYNSVTNPSVFSMYTNPISHQPNNEQPQLDLQESLQSHTKMYNLQNDDQSAQNIFAQDLSSNAYNQPIFYLRNSVPQKSTGSGPNVGYIELLSRKLPDKTELDINSTNNIHTRTEDTPVLENSTLETSRCSKINSTKLYNKKKHGKSSTYVHFTQVPTLSTTMKAILFFVLYFGTSFAVK